ncbi:PREDICTED: LOW QUALITY PROTEIN: lactosylceramide 4-alpha-galactosyltransferase-like [Ceratosolen solmsi marchali]|uniref:LOW QUALITY PROTEIN: lactosylceramide 4-alpha-galactosyltransferase-like n=1 Tax=Ceratosolen solmsi marchali TaxID=326594 RepID=A0AAJ6YBA0_9HYME|nr:PREDICTED: LOW QUALITY PROTEIN: lactosylceramide 4-alpha-galactosyltransferase-like [Ceratosolen solmsi marchali]
MKIKKRFVVFIFFIIISLFLVFSNDEIMRSLQLSILSQSIHRDISCYQKLSTKDSFPRFDIHKENIRLAAGRNIFFHETSCFGELGHAELNYRQACAVESAARMNPNMLVNLLFLSPSSPSNRTSLILEKLLEYENVRVNRVQINEYVMGTPIEQWFAINILETSNWPRSHMSDIMRFLTLWKYSGIYLDLDVVVTSSLEDLTDFAGAEDWIDVAAGVIGFSRTELGRSIANACIQDLMKNFRGNLWGNNGPGVITRTLQKFCAVQHVKDMTSIHCKGFKVFPPAVFYPIFYKDWKDYFSTKNINETMNVGSKVPYALIAEKYCPNVYESCGSIF